MTDPDLRPSEQPPSEMDLGMMAMGYTWCRPHAEYHRPPECPIDSAGQPNPTWAEEHP